MSAEPGASPLFEIRVHGVSGTPPQDMLQVPNVVRVAGDSAAGFYQAATASTAHPDVGQADPVEAYSWSGLTSGGRWRALWLLLVPFMLVNVAYYASSAPLSGRGRARRFHSTTLRLLALSMTFTFVLGIVSVSMDLVAWQYLRPGRDVTQPLLKWLRWEWLNLPRRQVVVASALPVAAVGLLWWLARQTWARTERTSVPDGQAPMPADTPLADRAMFNGRGPVRKLRAVHVAGGFAVIAAMLLMPAWRRNGDSLWHAAVRGGLLGVLTVLVVALLLLVVALACLPSMTDRARPDESRTSEFDIYTLLPWIALGITVGCGAFLCCSSAFSTAWPDAETSGGFTGYSDVIVWLFASQVLLVVASAIACWLQRKEGEQAAWAGFAPFVLAATGWLIAGGFSAALTLGVARVLGSPTASSRVNSARDLIVPTPYLWSSAVALGSAATLIPAIGWLLWRWHQSTTELRTEVPACYTTVQEKPDEPDLRARIGVIARQWGRARLTDRAMPVVAVPLCGTLALVVAAAIGYIISHDWILEHLSWAVTFGVFAMAGLAGLLIVIGRRAYSDQAERRTIGILWDLGTFWPRAVHPLAPPCYSERTLPDLLRRIEYRRAVTAGAPGAIVLSCHSQGTVIGAATVLQLDAGQAGSVGLLTYGSPLRRLYARIFPAYFGVPALQRIDAALSSRWLNLYRSSDPIGGYVFVDRFGHEGPSDHLDWWLIDPAFERPPGDGSWPPTRGHSDYWADPAYQDAVQALAVRFQHD